MDDCHADAPSSVLYEPRALVLTQGKAMTPVTPQIPAKAYTVTSFPTMPEGLTLNAQDGTISGTPSTVQETKHYTITVRNESGTAQTTITIEVLEAPTNWVMIIIIVVVAIIVAIVMATKKGSSKKKMPKTAKSGSKTVPKVTSVKTKPAVKV